VEEARVIFNSIAESDAELRDLISTARSDGYGSILVLTGAGGGHIVAGSAEVGVAINIDPNHPYAMGLFSTSGTVGLQSSVGGGLILGFATDEPDKLAGPELIGGVDLHIGAGAGGAVAISLPELKGSFPTIEIVLPKFTGFAVSVGVGAGVNVGSIGAGMTCVFDTAFNCGKPEGGNGQPVRVAIVGGDGDDEIKGKNGGDSIAGLDGNDELHGRDGNDELLGGPGDDILKGNRGKDVLIGGDGNDVIEGGFGDDLLEGGPGDDILKGEEDNDKLTGGDGNDTLFGGDGHDKLFGNDGDDRLHPGHGNGTIECGAGDDTVLLWNKKTDWTIKNKNGYIMVKEEKGDDHRQELYDCEHIKFKDKTIDI
jgi:Ca2+-binding RTX toxin-like protein